MRKALLSVVIIATITFSWFGCTKEEDIIVNIDTPTSCFKTYIYKDFPKAFNESTVALIDSSFYFKNCSDSTETIRYKWEFGDGTVSEEKEPVHTYSKPGRYTVTLTCSNRDKAFDSSSVVVSVIIGQKNIRTGENINNSAIDVVETGNGFLLLGTSYDTKVFPFVHSTFIMKLDENMNSTGTMAYPTNTRFNSISASHDGGFILTGTTTGNSKNNGLIKVDINGDVQWSKELGQDNEFSTVYPSTDNGYILTGTRGIPVNNNSQPRNVLVKTDAAGNVLWEKLLNGDIVMENAYNLVVENDGYVIAGVKKSTACRYCDSLVIAKMNHNGNMVWKNTVEWAINSNSFRNTRIAKMKNGNYSVINSNTRGVYIFSASGEFVDRRLLKYSTHYHTATNEGNLVFLQHEYGNGFRASAAGLSPEGLVQWTRQIDGRQFLDNGVYRCCSSSWPVAIHALKKGGSILLANRVDETAGFNLIYVPVLLQLDEAGNPK